MKESRQQGFSLVELMIAVAIVGILASIAIPAYRDSILKGKRAEARTALSELMLQQERFMTQSNTYLAFSNVGGTTTPASVPFKTFSGDSLAKTSYYLSASACTSLTIQECVVITASPVNADPDAGDLQMLSTGTKSCTGSKPTVCWK
jgi:type IV pilus assembly protein PilE